MPGEPSGSGCATTIAWPSHRRWSASPRSAAASTCRSSWPSSRSRPNHSLPLGSRPSPASRRVSTASRIATTRHPANAPGNSAACVPPKPCSTNWRRAGPCCRRSSATDCRTSWSRPGTASDADLVSRLPGLGYSALSTFGPPEPDAMRRLNSDLDIIDWRNGRVGRPLDDLWRKLAGLLGRAPEIGRTASDRVAPSPAVMAGLVPATHAERRHGHIGAGRRGSRLPSRRGWPGQARP